MKAFAHHEMLGIKPSLIPALLLTAVLSQASATAAPGEIWYGERPESDAGLYINLRTGCGRDLGLNSKCYRFTRVNNFAIDVDGTLMCDFEKTPAPRQPLTYKYKCTSKGWK